MNIGEGGKKREREGSKPDGTLIYSEQTDSYQRGGGWEDG